ncbi:MAG TPA: BPSS1780 family membrane protein [Xanthomonadales bacterium]|nr:BPSS1780 family membrane protein [Xanthomonadales bacterium]
MADEITFTRHEGRRGVLWLVESYRMFSRYRVPWIMMLFGYYAVLLIVDIVPLIGVFIAPMIKPVLSVGFLAAAWTQERGGKPDLRLLLRGFGANIAALLPLGIVFVAGVSLALAATALVDGGQLLELLYGAAPAGEADPTGAARHVQQTLGSTRVQLALLFGALCAVPTILALWWAPALVVFQDARTLTALRTSLRAGLANWRAALRYGLAVFTLGAVVPMIVMTLLAYVIPPPLNATLAALIVLPYLTFFVATLHISDYVSYRDVFHTGETLAPLAGAAR